MNGICDGLSPPQTTTGTLPAWWTSGPTPLAFHPCLPSFMCRTSNVLVRLPVAVFSLAFRKSMPMPWSGCILPMTHCETPYIYARIRMPPAYVFGGIISIPPVKSCRRRRHFSPQMRVNRFVFLNLPILSHGDHLGVTTSPQSPFPTGYVTLPVDDRPPPLGLIPLHSKG